MAKFNIEARLHRFTGPVRLVTWIRNYARIETAVRRCTEFLIIEGEIGDLIEFTLKINGYQVGTIRLKATGKMDVLWNDTEAKLLRNKQLMEKKDVRRVLPINKKSPPASPMH